MFSTIARTQTVLARDFAITAADAAGELFGALIGEGDSFMVETEDVALVGTELSMKLRGAWFALDIITVPVDEMVVTALRNQIIFSATSEDAEDKLTENVSVFSEVDSDTIYFFAADSTTKVVLRAL